MAEKSNGVVYVENIGEEEAHKKRAHPDDGGAKDDVTLYGVLRRLISAIVSPAGDDATPLLQRIKASVSDNAPLFPEASRNTARNVLLWTRRGSHLRALLVISVGTITLLALTGLVIFTLFFLVATFNAIVISLLISLAAAGGFLALFFACVVAVYIGALSIAAFVISVTAISTIIAVLIVTGWIGFFFTVWLATKKSMGLAKRSLSATGSAISAYSSARNAHQDRDVAKVSD